MLQLVGGVLPRPIKRPLRWLKNHLWSELFNRFLPNTVCFIGRQIGVAVKERDIVYKNGAFHRQTRRHIELVDFILGKNIHLDSSVLDVGCGMGWLAERLYDAGFRKILGCDWIDASKLSQSVSSKIIYSQVDFNTNGLSLYSNHSIDVIVSSDVLEHLENPARMLREFERILAPGGHTFITIPNAFNRYERWFIWRNGNSSRYQSERVYPQSPAFAHISMLPYWVLESLCDRAGLEIVQEGGGYLWWKHHFWFPNRRFSHLYSYNASYHLMRKADIKRHC